MIKIFTADHEELLYERIGQNDLECPKTAAVALARAAVKLDNNLDLQDTTDLFLDFLKENDHIYFDGFLRICVYDS